MSNNVKVPWLQARTVAQALINKLEPACHRIKIAGSLRRRMELVGDIELVAIPRMDIDLFGSPLDTSDLDRLLAECPVTMHKNGAKYKQFSFTGTSGYTYKVDLFLQPDPATWGVNFMLRTGSAQFSHRMVTPKWQGGYKPDELEVKDARVWRAGLALDTPEEEAVFDLWGMKFVKPEARS